MQRLVRNPVISQVIDEQTGSNRSVGNAAPYSKKWASSTCQRLVNLMSQDLTLPHLLTTSMQMKCRRYRVEISPLISFI